MNTNNPPPNTARPCGLCMGLGCRMCDGTGKYEPESTVQAAGAGAAESAADSLGWSAELLARSMTQLRERWAVMKSMGNTGAGQRQIDREWAPLALETMARFFEELDSAIARTPAAAPAVAPSGDRMAYEGAREDLLMWKRRAQEAEELVRKFTREVNSSTYMGEPSHPQPSGAVQAAPVAASEDDQQAAFEKWVLDVCPSGDVEDVQRQWERSSDYFDLFEIAATPPAVAPSEPVAVVSQISSNLGNNEACLSNSMVKLIEALEFYSSKSHFHMDDESKWDDCSGEPRNFLFHEETTDMLEDGGVARAALESIGLKMTPAQHTKALEEIEGLMFHDPSPESPAGQRLEALSKEVEAYEKIRFPLYAATPLLPLQGAPEGWKPIESAPKDGTEFQAWVDFGTVAQWEPRARFNPASEAFEIQGRIDYDMEGWDASYSATPTHWQPQPTTPTAPGAAPIKEAT